MKLLTRDPPQNGQTEPTSRRQVAFELGTTTPHRWEKQRQKLLKLRDKLSKRMHQLAANACEERTSYSMHIADAATDTFDRDLVLGLVSFEQDVLYEMEANRTFQVWNEFEPANRFGWRNTAKEQKVEVEVQEKLEGCIHPHIGVLGRVRSREEERSKSA